MSRVHRRNKRHGRRRAQRVQSRVTRPLRGAIFLNDTLLFPDVEVLVHKFPEWIARLTNWSSSC